MSHPYDASYPVPFPVLPVVLRQIDGSARTSPLPALVDSGADVTIAPKALLGTVGAEEIFSGHLRAHWDGRRPVTVPLVDLEVEGQLLPGIEVVGDEEGQDVLLGRNVLNKLIVLLDGPGRFTEVLSRRSDHI